MLHTLGAVNRGYLVVAETEYTILRIRKETLLAVLEAHFELAMALQAGLWRSLLQGN